MFVKEHNSQRVTVEGNVGKPGVIPMAGGMTLIQAIAQAGGLGVTAEKTAIVFRMVGGRRLPAKYDISDIRAGNAEDPQLESGDVVVVPTSDMKEGVDYVVKFLPLANFAPLLRHCSKITAPSGLFSCPPAALQKGLHIPSVALPHDALLKRIWICAPFCTLQPGQDSGATRLTYFRAMP